MSSSLSNPPVAAGGSGSGVVSMDIDDVPAGGGGGSTTTTTSNKRNTNDDIHQLPWVEKYRPQRYVVVNDDDATLRVCVRACVRVIVTTSTQKQKRNVPLTTSSICSLSSSRFIVNPPINNMTYM